MPRIFRASRQAVRLDVGFRSRAGDRPPAATVWSIFRDPERAAISVLYRQANGDLTLVETEA